jgi:heme/copper-type cytochrome/quinol oxidase subunit 2
MVYHLIGVTVLHNFWSFNRTDHWEGEGEVSLLLTIVIWIVIIIVWLVIDIFLYSLMEKLEEMPNKKFFKWLAIIVVNVILISLVYFIVIK